MSEFQNQKKLQLSETKIT